MKFALDSNLSLSLASKCSERAPAVLALGIDQLNCDGPAETVASYFNLEFGMDRSTRSQLTTEQSSIRAKLAADATEGTEIQIFESEFSEMKWYSQRDANNRVLTFLATGNLSERRILKLVERVKTAIVHFGHNPRQIQSKIESIATMFNQPNSSNNSTIEKRQDQDKTDTSSAKDCSRVLIENHPQTGNESKFVADDSLAAKAAIEATIPKRRFKLSKRTFAMMFLGLLILWIFYNKFIRVRHRRH